ncbi:hypothetical protein QZN06_20675, partial [Burkholderia multivorans]|nr:hypothetical protein [Burkholderia multivorans]
ICSGTSTSGTSIRNGGLAGAVRALPSPRGTAAQPAGKTAAAAVPPLVPCPPAPAAAPATDAGATGQPGA